jgi:hypothetical protein
VWLINRLIPKLAVANGDENDHSKKNRYIDHVTKKAGLMPVLRKAASKNSRSGFPPRPTFMLSLTFTSFNRYP